MPCSCFSRSIWHKLTCWSSAFSLETLNSQNIPYSQTWLPFLSPGVVYSHSFLIHLLLVPKACLIKIVPCLKLFLLHGFYSCLKLCYDFPRVLTKYTKIKKSHLRQLEVTRQSGSFRAGLCSLFATSQWRHGFIHIHSSPDLITCSFVSTQNSFIYPYSPLSLINTIPIQIYNSHLPHL